MSIVSTFKFRFLGRKIYEEFSTVVILTQQKRVHDLIWYQFLTRLRKGEVNESDLTMLRSLILGVDSNGTNQTNWKQASMITPRHAVRKAWNKEACREMCAMNGQRLFICLAQDSVGDHILTSEDKINIASKKTSKKGKALPDEIEIGVGMKVLVTYNIQTNLDITNGARGMIVDIVLDPRDAETVNSDEPICQLQYLPKYILVRLERTRVSKLAGLEDNMIPIEPMTISMEAEKHTGHGWSKISIRRTQYPLTAAYAFTDFRSQGQTINQAIIDIAPPPRGTLSLFNLYVALSRSPGRNDICLLRDFKDEMFLKTHDNDLLKEDERLEDMSMFTKG